MAKQRGPHTFGAFTTGSATIALTHADLTAAAPSQTLTFAQLLGSHPKGQAIPADATLEIVEVLLITEFAGGLAATAVFIAGEVAGDTDELFTAVNVFTGAGAGKTQKNGALSLPVFAAAYVGQVSLTITGDTVDNLTAGALEIRFAYRASIADNTTL